MRKPLIYGRIYRGRVTVYEKNESGGLIWSYVDETFMPRESGSPTPRAESGAEKGVGE